MPTATIQVSAITAPDQWTLGAGADKVGAVNEPDDDDTSYILSAGAGIRREQYSLAGHSIPVGSTINSISMYGRCKRALTNASWYSELFLAGNYAAGTIHPSGGSYASFTDAIARPGGGPWAYSDLVSLEVAASTAHTNQTRRTSLWIIVDYTPPPSAMFLAFD